MFDPAYGSSPLTNFNGSQGRLNTQPLGSNTGLTTGANTLGDTSNVPDPLNTATIVQNNTNTNPVGRSNNNLGNGFNIGNHPMTTPTNLLPGSSNMTQRMFQPQYSSNGQPYNPYSYQDSASRYQAWIAAGAPAKDQFGNPLDVRGSPIIYGFNDQDRQRGVPGAQGTVIHGPNGLTWTPPNYISPAGSTGTDQFGNPTMTSRFNNIPQGGYTDREGNHVDAPNAAPPPTPGAGSNNKNNNNNNNNNTNNNNNGLPYSTNPDFNSFSNTTGNPTTPGSEVLSGSQGNFSNTGVPLNRGNIPSPVTDNRRNNFPNSTPPPTIGKVLQTGNPATTMSGDVLNGAAGGGTPPPSTGTPPPPSGGNIPLGNWNSNDPNNPLIAILGGRNPYGAAGRPLYNPDGGNGDPRSVTDGSIANNFIWNDPRYFDQYITPGSEGGGGETNYRMNAQTLPHFIRNGVRYAQVGLPNVGAGGSGNVIDPNLVIYDPEFGMMTPQNNIVADKSANNGDMAAFIIGGSILGGVTAGAAMGGFGTTTAGAGLGADFVGPPAALGTTIPGAIPAVTAPTVGGLGAGFTAAGGGGLFGGGGLLGTGIPDNFLTRTIAGQVIGRGIGALTGDNQGGGITGGGGNGTTNPWDLITGGGSLINDNNNINNFNNRVDQLINRGDFNSLYRPGQLEMLNNFLANPDAALNSPGYQQMRQHQLDNEDRMLNAKGFSFSGNEMGDLMSYGKELDYKHINDYENQLRQAAGLGDPSGMARAGIEAAGKVFGAKNNLNSGIGNLLSKLGGIKVGGKSLADWVKGLMSGSLKWSDLDPQTRQAIQDGGIYYDNSGNLVIGVDANGQPIMGSDVTNNDWGTPDFSGGGGIGSGGGGDGGDFTDWIANYFGP